MKSKNFRNLAVIMAIIGLMFMIATTWLDLPVGDWEEGAILLAGVFVALGILVNTGIEPQPITWTSIKEKMKSPLCIASLFSLIAFIFYKILEPDKADMILKILDMIVLSMFGFSVYNNPNNRSELR